MCAFKIDEDYIIRLIGMTKKMAKIKSVKTWELQIRGLKSSQDSKHVQRKHYDSKTPFIQASCKKSNHLGEKNYEYLHVTTCTCSY